MDLSETQITGVKEMLQKWLSNKTTNHIILEHPKMNWWLTPKCKEFANLTKSTLITVEGFGELVQSEKQVDDNNYPWKLIELDYLIDNIASVS